MIQLGKETFFFIPLFHSFFLQSVTFSFLSFFLNEKNSKAICFLKIGKELFQQQEILLNTLHLESKELAVVGCDLILRSKILNPLTCLYLYQVFHTEVLLNPCCNCSQGRFLRI